MELDLLQNNSATNRRFSISLWRSRLSLNPCLEGALTHASKAFNAQLPSRSAYGVFVAGDLSILASDKISGTPTRLLQEMANYQQHQ
jgi:hypothetical protein